AAIGAAVGAGTGAATTPEQVNLGEPVWDRDKRPSYARAGDDVRRAQTALAQQGYYRGRIDGLAGPQTRDAVAQYQRRNGMPVSGALDGATMARLDSQLATTTYGSSGTAPGQISPGRDN